MCSSFIVHRFTQIQWNDKNINFEDEQLSARISHAIQYICRMRESEKLHHFKHFALSYSSSVLLFCRRLNDCLWIMRLSTLIGRDWLLRSIQPDERIVHKLVEHLLSSLFVTLCAQAHPWPHEWVSNSIFVFYFFFILLIQVTLCCDSNEIKSKLHLFAFNALNVSVSFRWRMGHFV